MPHDNRIKTYIPQLDDALGGGIRRGHGLGVYGPLGLGKTILSMQVAYNNIIRSRKCSFHTHDQNSDMLIEMMKSFGWDPEPYMEYFYIVDRFSELTITEDELEDQQDPSFEDFMSNKLGIKPLLSRTLKEIQTNLGGFPDLVIIDSATPLLIQIGGRKLYLLYQMAKRLLFRSTASIVTCHSEVVDQRTLNSLFSLSDYFIQLEKNKDGSCCIQIEKSMDSIETPKLKYNITNEGINPIKVTSTRTRI
jgi:KaiC/GvpD/RAD55 family RecA-like ATPase